MQARLTIQLGLTQTVGYASSYYLSAILAAPISAELGFPFEAYFMFVAAASILGGILGPIIGQQIDRFGGRLILPGSSIAFAIGLVLMSISTDLLSFAAAWLITGAAMAAGLYEAAFATVVEIMGENSRRTIAGVTLIAGFASTIGWPITAFFEQQFSWREAILFWAACHLVITLPLHIWLPVGDRNTRRARRSERAEAKHPHLPAAPRLVVLAAALFVFGGFVQVALGAHLPGLLVSSGVEISSALWAATLLGPGQVLARLLQVVFPSLFSAVRVTILALILHPIAVLILLLPADFAPMVFAFVHGMGSGFQTVAAGVLPLYLFGARNYGQRQGYIMAASDILLSFAPVVFGLALVRFGGYSLSFTSASSLIGLAILAVLVAQHRRNLDLGA